MATHPDCSFCQAIGDPVAHWGENLIWRFPHSFAVLGPWQFFSGYSLLISREHATELSMLGPHRSAFLNEMALLAEAIECCFHPHKMNYELLGNQVPHLHWHLFPRSKQDPDRLRPVWLVLEKAASDPDEKARLEGSSIPGAEAVSRLQSWLKNTPGIPGSPGL
jgi:diadenosine tetraphosphate (Ap4A) HIT family hydrolase